VFGTGQFAPANSQGQRLIAHELTHVMQQRDYIPGSHLEIGPSADPYERQADSFANDVSRDLPGGNGVISHPGAVLQPQAGDAGQVSDVREGANKKKERCPMHEANPGGFALRIALEYFMTELKGSVDTLATGVQCVSNDYCKVTYPDGIVIDVLLVEIPKQVSAGATINGKAGKLCDYSYTCPKEPGPVTFKKLKCE
jgi:hypothetical protein